MKGLFVLIGATLVVGLAVCASGLLFSLPVWLLWNGCIVGTIAGVGEITWLQSWGILILCGFLFKSSSTKTEPKKTN
jgi:hypothetical protein